MTINEAYEKLKEVDDFLYLSQNNRNKVVLPDTKLKMLGDAAYCIFLCCRRMEKQIEEQEVKKNANECKAL